MERPLVTALVGVVLLAGMWGPAYGDIINQYGGTYDSWPTTWQPIVGLNDPDDGVQEQLDFVGDATDGGAFWAVNGDYMFFRMRVDIGAVPAGTYHDTVMIIVDKTGDGVPDYAFSWDTKGAELNQHGMELNIPDVSGTSWSTTKMDDIDGNVAKKIAPPDLNTSGDGYLRTVDGQNTGNFGTTTYIEWAVSWDYLSTNTTLGFGQTWRVQFGSISDATDHNFITEDVAGNRNPTDTGLNWSQEFTNPEPGSLSLLALALGSLALSRRRRRTGKA
jgi:hypothetical protein